MLNLIAVLSAVTIVAASEIGIVQGNIAAIFLLAGAISLFLYSVVRSIHVGGVMYKEPSQESQALTFEGYGVKMGASERLLTKDRMVSIVAYCILGVFLWQHHATTEQSNAKMLEAVAEFTYVISLPQAEREKLSIAMPESLRRKLRFATP